MSTPTFDSIVQRRSIRKFNSTPVPKALLEELLLAGILAPSAKNRQPWQFTVTLGAEKEKATQAMARGLQREQEQALSPGLADAFNTLRIMEQAPALIFITNPFAHPLEEPLPPEERISDLCNTLSVGAAIENMSLAAQALGLGTLWIANTFFAYEELQAYLGLPGVLLSALAVGYPDESPAPRPRTPQAEVVDWRE